jgi:general secretion pathway protein D
MKKTHYFRFLISLLLIAAMLAPTTAFAAGLGEGKRHFNKGMEHEAHEEWDAAVEEYALAVSANPKNAEYRLHLQRSLFQASQMYMKRGTEAANEKNYDAGYNAFKKAYSYDPTNELAKAEMDRMVRMQQGDSGTQQPGAPKTSTGGNGNLKLSPASYNPQKDFPKPASLERLRDVPFPGGVDLQFIIKELAKDLDLNVLFDSQTFRTSRTVKIDLKNVSAAQALDDIFLQENLFFQKVGPKTILVADSARRPNFQQLVLRTFYLQNADPTKIKPLIQQAIPAQPGRSQTIVMDDAATNSITVRDTEENIRLIGKLLASLDKDRAEVVMDVSIYEVNKNDLLQIGNQIGGPTGGELTQLGGTTRAVVDATRGGNLYGTLTRPIVGGILGLPIPSVFGAGLVIPSATLNAFQSNGHTKLLASTQIHAFNNEESSANIGQRVPVQTAQFVGVGATTPGANGAVQNVINYEQIGLTLKFKPLVFPNQDVQVAMDIESKDVTAGPDPLTPIFTERTIHGTARIQNNKTLLLASVASNSQSDSRTSLPILGLIPVLGHLFTAPTNKNAQLDIVIAVTPRVIRAPVVLPDDEVERPTGSQATPTNSSLEAMIIEDARDEQIAAARREPTNTNVQLPDQPNTPAYVRTSSNSNDTDANKADTATAANATNQANPPVTDASALKPIDTSVKTLNIKQTSDTSTAPADQPPALVRQSTPTPPVRTLQPTDDPAANKPATQSTDDPAAAKPAAQSTDDAASKSTSSKASFRLGDIPELKANDKVKVPVYIDSSSPFMSAVVGLKFDATKLAVRSVQYGDVFGEKANSSAPPFINQDGKMYVSLTADKAADKTSGIIAYIEIEALADGRPDITFDKDMLNIQSWQGKSLPISY